MGLGQQAGSHADVGVIVPFPEFSEITAFIVKATNANDRNGAAVLHHDAGPFPLLACDLINNTIQQNGALFEVSPGKTVCFVDNQIGVLDEVDSLSVFVNVAGINGSFQGATACVLIKPEPATGPGPF